eukprot:3175103-Rhodomonas_salina.2
MQQRRRTRGGFKDCTKQLAAASAHTGSSRADRTCQEPPPFNSCANKPWQRLPRLEFRNGNSSSQPGSPARNQIEISRGSIQNSTKSCARPVHALPPQRALPDALPTFLAPAFSAQTAMTGAARLIPEVVADTQKFLDENAQEKTKRYLSLSTLNGMMTDFQRLTWQCFVCPIAVGGRITSKEALSEGATWPLLERPCKKLLPNTVFALGLRMIEFSWECA